MSDGNTSKAKTTAGAIAMKGKNREGEVGRDEGAGPTEETGGSSASGGTKQATERSATQSSGEASGSQAQEQGEEQQELDGIIRELRKGNLGKLDATAQICQFIGSFEGMSKQEKEVTIRSYLGEINVTESRPGPGVSGMEDEALSEGASKRVTSQVSAARSTRTDHYRDNVDDFIDSVTGNSARGGDGDSDGDDEPASKHHKLKRSNMPCCIESMGLLELFNRDLSGAEFYVKTSASAPQGFPSSQWKRILKGEPVDLDHVLSALHCTTFDEERGGRIGDTAISLGTAAPAKRVKTASEWSTAWRHAARATSFMFKHRKQELDDYGEYIECGQQTLLTDIDRFTHLYAAIVMPDGIDHASGSYRRTTRSSAKSEICHKFNNGTCTARDGCGQTGHGEKSCPNKQK
ncbi:hypothetical protein CPB84DRAFT_1754433 [Gymnopilus junonius]|uniref:Uncharacterized protein n=1 Tax=Gymnopilus junonius TaxID=109634 RepID=A0A9P5N9S9_GYMJU|nr:hypothetical protein CPB84DRAFT_1754433 [Gymnopilus junonius]